jgi:acyl-CoA thioesterase
MSDPAATDPDEVARRTAEQMWSRDAASRALGVELDEVAPGLARARLRVTESMLNGHGICHGGLVFLLADTAFAFACNSHGAETVAAGCDIVFVSPARLGDELVAEASERTRFGRNGVYDVTVRRGDGSVVAEFRGQSRTTGGRA